MNRGSINKSFFRFAAFPFWLLIGWEAEEAEEAEECSLTSPEPAWRQLEDSLWAKYADAVPRDNVSSAAVMASEPLHTCVSSDAPPPPTFHYFFSFFLSFFLSFFFSLHFSPFSFFVEPVPTRHDPCIPFLSSHRSYPLQCNNKLQIHLSLDCFNSFHLATTTTTTQLPLQLLPLNRLKCCSGRGSYPMRQLHSSYLERTNNISLTFECGFFSLPLPCLFVCFCFQVGCQFRLGFTGDVTITFNFNVNLLFLCHYLLLERNFDLADRFAMKEWRHPSEPSRKINQRRLKRVGRGGGGGGGGERCHDDDEFRQFLVVTPHLLLLLRR